MAKTVAEIDGDSSGLVSSLDKAKEYIENYPIDILKSVAYVEDDEIKDARTPGKSIYFKIMEIPMDDMTPATLATYNEISLRRNDIEQI